MSLRWSYLFALALVACNRAAPPTTGTVSDERFHSTIVNDDYILRIRLPVGYESATRSYPLVVQLDPTYVGLHEFDVSAGLVSEHAAAGQWSEAIVVGIDYPDPFTRERDYRLPATPVPDYSGDAADRFYRVVESEILPYLDGKLRTDPAHRILVGHSNGGVFAWYTVFRHAPPAAPLFSGVVAADCGFDEGMFTYQRWHAARSQSLPLNLYASHAVYNGAVQKILFDAMIDRVHRANYEGLTLRAEELETDHGGAIYPSFETGLGMNLGGGK